MPFPIEQPAPLSGNPAADIRALHRRLDALADELNRNFDELAGRINALQPREDTP